MISCLLFSCYSIKRRENNIIFLKKLKKILTKDVFLYIIALVSSERQEMHRVSENYINCRSGGIGRRAGFRCLW